MSSAEQYPIPRRQQPTVETAEGQVFEAHPNELVLALLARLAGSTPEEFTREALRRASNFPATELEFDNAVLSIERQGKLFRLLQSNAIDRAAGILHQAD